MTGASGHVLLVDDEPAFQRLGGTWLQGLGFRVTIAGDAPSAVASFEREQPDIVLLDLVMPPNRSPEAGLGLIAAFGSAPVILITGHADHELALRATDLGAWDFIAKPIDPDLLRLVVTRAIQKARLQDELRRLRTGRQGDDFGIVGHSPAIRHLRELITRIGPTSVSVVILGPTGTGKELVARALHRAGPRADGPFVAVHCGAIPGELLESELFGHLKGSFTGAYRDQRGLVEAAHRGTLFLDEIGEMPASMQVKLLRFLQEGTFLPVGAREPRRSDARILAATHRDLEAMVTEGRFRDDLFYRLKGIILRTPALAERAGDVPLLAALFLGQASGRKRARLTEEAVSWLQHQTWPGNVRELQSLMACAAALAGPASAGETVVDAALLGFARGDAILPAAPARHSLDEEIAALETRMITAALATSGNNRSEAARVLGISRVGLLNKMARLGLR